MMTSNKNIYNIPGTCSFWDTLAEIYINKFADKKLSLASCLFLLPNRRACQALINAFIRKQGVNPAILPQIVPITEIDDDELFFGYFNIENIWNSLPQSIRKEERLFLFARMIMLKPNDFGIKQLSPVQAISLSMDLANLIDTATNQGLSFDKLEDLVPDKYASHWQQTLELLKIITKYWPQILDERKSIDVSELKKQILFKQAQLWEKENTNKCIIAAGITASFPAIVKLLSIISNLPNGELYFAGIDKFSDNNYWDAIDETHPQFELKELLDKLNIDRHRINNITNSSNQDREKLVFEMMRPAVVSNKWLDVENSFDKTNAISNIEVINCNSQRDEALVIALTLRKILNIPEKTAALVTYDRNLARRVVNELKRFDIIIDDSAGIPLTHTPIGIFLRLIVDVAKNGDKKTKLLDLLKNPYTLLGNNVADFRKKVYNLEFNLRKNNDFEKDILETIQNKLEDLSNLISSDSVDFSELLRLHIKTAENIASSDSLEGKNLLWRGDEGKTAVNFISKLLETGSTIGNIKGKDYLDLLSLLMSNETVRTSFGTHPRLNILGPIEAHLQHFDYVIIGEVNEGFWPKLNQPDMWMSRPMMKDFGFSLPEKNIGILGNIFAHLMMKPNVIITRADRIDGTPTKKSRWLLRLETVLQAMGQTIEDITNNDFLALANSLDTPLKFTPIKAPEPTPPISTRPRKLSASGIDLLMHDPYSVFAKYILNLYPLDDLDRELDQRDYGTLIHSIIEEFNNRYPSLLPDNPIDVLIDIGKDYFDKLDLSSDTKSFWFSKFLGIADWIVEQEKDYRFNIKHIHNEISGEICYNFPMGDFRLTAKADRIDELKDGSINILDYKTGKIPTLKQIKSGHALQLLIEGLIAKERAFNNIKSNKIDKLVYWQLGNSKLELDEEVDELLEKTEEYLKKLINIFDFETTPYHCRPTPKFIPKNRDYEHLARIKEWSVQEEGESNDE